jgi:hypothetical protein
MSQIRFHSEEETVDVSGAERHHAHHVCKGMMAAVLYPLEDKADHPSWLRAYLPEGHYLTSAKTRDFAADAAIWLRSGDGHLVLNGRCIPLFGLMLNTAYHLGGETVKFLARLDGQCEMYCYVEDANRDWLSWIIRHGLQCNILRSGMGWAEVSRMLHRVRGPVVMSYSVTSGFPDQDLAYHWGTWAPTNSEDDDAVEGEWSSMSWHQRWELSMEALRKQHGLEITPETWEHYQFDSGLTILDLLPQVGEWL